MTTETNSPLHRWRWYGMVLIVFALSAGARVLFLYDVHGDPTYHHLVHDEAVNDQVACAILNGQMPRVSFYKAPLYMYALAGLYAVLGEEPMWARWVQIFIDSLIPVLLLLITRRLFGMAAGVVAGIVAAVFWTFVFHAAELVDTSLACLFYVLLAYLLVAIPDGRAYKWPICGAVLGLGAITRPNILAFAPVLALTIVITGLARRQREAGSWREERAAPSRGRAFRRSVLAVIGLAVGCCLTVLPVTIRNYVVAGEPTLIATYGGLNAYVANSPWSDGKHGPLIVGEGVPDISAIDLTNLWSRLDLNYDVAKTYAQKQLGRELTMAEVDAFFYDLTRRTIRENPRKFLGDCFKRFCWFFNRYEFPNVKDFYRLCGVSPVLNALSFVHFGLLCPLAVLGIMLAVATRHRAPGLAYYAAMLAALFVPGVFFVMNARYRLPTVCLLVPFAAYGLVRFIDLWRRDARWSLRIGSCAVLIGIGLLSNLNVFGYADSEHTELRMTYAQACERTGRLDLLRDAAGQFERAYLDELEHHNGHPWAHILHNCAPMTWLFIFYHDLEQESGRPDDAEKALHYGTLMMRREMFNPTVFVMFLDDLLKKGHQERAREMLDVIETRLLTFDPERTVNCFILYCQRFADPPVLRHLLEVLERLSGRYPDNAYYHLMLDKARRMLARAESESQPSTVPAGQPASRQAP